MRRKTTLFQKTTGNKFNRTRTTNVNNSFNRMTTTGVDNLGSDKIDNGVFSNTDRRINSFCPKMQNTLNQDQDTKNASEELTYFRKFTKQETVYNQNIKTKRRVVTSS